MDELRPTLADIGWRTFLQQQLTLAELEASIIGKVQYQSRKNKKGY